MFSPTNHKINIVGAALLKHQQWRKWIGEDTNHGQIINNGREIAFPLWRDRLYLAMTYQQTNACRLASVGSTIPMHRERASVGLVRGSSFLSILPCRIAYFVIYTERSRSSNGKSMKIEGKTILSGLVGTPTTDNYILLVPLC